MRAAQLAKALEVCEKFYFDEIVFEYGAMKIQVKQDGLRTKAVSVIAKNFDKAKTLKGDQLQDLVDMVNKRGE